jgi:hypothetical protein
MRLGSVGDTQVTVQGRCNCTWFNCTLRQKETVPPNTCHTHPNPSMKLKLSTIKAESRGMKTHCAWGRGSRGAGDAQLSRPCGGLPIKLQLDRYRTAATTNSTCLLILLLLLLGPCCCCCPRCCCHSGRYLQYCLPCGTVGLPQQLQDCMYCVVVPQLCCAYGRLCHPVAQDDARVAGSHHSSTQLRGDACVCGGGGRGEGGGGSNGGKAG